MDQPPISVRIAGTTYKVHASAPEERMNRLAEIVEAKLVAMNPRGRPITPNMFVLVALALANDAEEERDARQKVEHDELEKRKRLERETRDLLRRMVARIDLALEEEDGAPDEDEQPSPEP